MYIGKKKKKKTKKNHRNPRILVFVLPFLSEKNVFKIKCIEKKNQKRECIILVVILLLY